MNDINFTVQLKCLFCDSPLMVDTDKKYSSGDLLKCQECEEYNDYDALIDFASEEGKEIATNYAQSELNKIAKSLFK